ncbi:MAG TPA: Rrf2 family transcriptional regulator [Acidimicrobiia bacterium]
MTPQLMNITFQRRTDLALLALRALAASGGIMSRNDLASETGTTSSFIPQVVAPLVEAGWVTSSRGPGGGYRIAGSAFDVHLLEVVEAVEGPSSDGRCGLRDAPCPGEESCPIHDIWTEARRVLVEGFDQVLVLPNMQGAQS